jgi:outer membrane murein-binding lipoprotein Lpp
MIDSGRIEAAKGSLEAATSVAHSAGDLAAGGPETIGAALPMVVQATDYLGTAITLVCDALSLVIEELNKLTDPAGKPDPDEAKFSGIDSAIAELKADFAKLAPQPPDGSEVPQVRVDSIKSDVDELRAEIAQFEGLRGDVEQAVATIHSDMEALQNQFRTDMEALRSQVSAG